MSIMCIQVINQQSFNENVVIIYKIHLKMPLIENVLSMFSRLDKVFGENAQHHYGDNATFTVNKKYEIVRHFIIKT